MAYHIGRLLHLHFGYELVNIHMYDTHAPIFAYDVPITTMSIADVEQAVTADDLLVVNPSFSSHLFGLRLPGKKLMYIQDFRTFLLLDCHFDHYVAVSSLVARDIQALYGINPPVIPAFIRTEKLPVTRPWQERSKNSALVYMKNPTREHQILLQHVRSELSRIAPQLDLSTVIHGRDLPQEEFLRRIGEVRYFVNMSLAEGFGLVPLEAMAMGTMVTGVDGLAGGDYMRQGQNCLTGTVRDLRNLAETIKQACTDDELAAHCIDGGFATAQQYGYEPFKAAWIKYLAQALGREAQHV